VDGEGRTAFRVRDNGAGDPATEGGTVATLDVLVEFVAEQPEAFTAFMEIASAPARARVAHAERIGRDIAVASLQFTDAEPPVPMFSDTVIAGRGSAARGFEAFGEPRENPDVPASSVVMRATVDESRLEELASRPNVRLWPNSALTLLQAPVDCQPFRPAVSMAEVRTALGVDAMELAGGGRGRGIGVGILDEGVNGTAYPLAGGFALPGAQQPGTAPVTSHGSMCAADVLVAAPEADLFDYPFLGVPSSGGALRMFQALLDDRRRTGTPHVSSNSYGFVAVPSRALTPTHEIYDLNHPLHRKVREVVASGVTVLFAAGNCGANCPSGACESSSIGPGSSIHASNSLAEVITVAAVNTAGTRVGYSSQGPGMFELQKPDVASFTHFFGNFGAGRPGGGTNFDNGTSAATPVAAGVVAALLSGAPALTPAQVKRALIASTGYTTWNADLGFGTIHAARSWAAVRAMLT
jgi:serine protease AprX